MLFICGKCLLPPQTATIIIIHQSLSDNIRGSSWLGPEAQVPNCWPRPKFLQLDNEGIQMFKSYFLISTINGARPTKFCPDMTPDKVYLRLLIYL